MSVQRRNRYKVYTRTPEQCPCGKQVGTTYVHRSWWVVEQPGRCDQGDHTVYIIDGPFDDDSEVWSPWDNPQDYFNYRAERMP